MERKAAGGVREREYRKLMQIVRSLRESAGKVSRAAKKEKMNGMCYA